MFIKLKLILLITVAEVHLITAGNEPIEEIVDYFISEEPIVLPGAHAKVLPFDYLERAVKSDDVTGVADLLHKHFANNLNAANASSWTPLHLAAAFGARKVLDYLLKHGANVNAANDQNELPLHVATWKHHADVVKILLERIESDEVRQRMIGALDASGRAVVCIASQIGNVHILRHLFQLNNMHQKEAIFDETQCPFGQPQRIGNPLHVAVLYNQAEIVEYMLANGRKRLVKTVDSTKANALHVAAFREVLMFRDPHPILPEESSDLLPQGSGMEPPGAGKDVRGPMVVSLFVGSAMQEPPSDTIGLALLDNGVEMEGRDNEGRTPFLAAVHAGAVQYAKFLHSEGANVSAVDDFGLNAFHIANSPKMLAFLTELVTLKQLRYDVNGKTPKCLKCLTAGSLNPLQIAILEGKPLEVIRFLLRHNAEIGAVNDLGETSIHMALRLNNSEALSLLLNSSDAFQTLQIADNHGKKPLQISVEQGSVAMTRKILATISSEQSNDTNAIQEFLKELDSQSTLHEAVVRKNYHAFKSVLEQDVEAISANRGDQFDELEEFFDVVARDDLARFQEMLHAHFRDNVNVQNGSGWTPLHVAALNDANMVGEYLLKYGANVSLANANGELPIHMAVWGNSYRFLEFMLRQLDMSSNGDADIIETEQNEGKTAIFYAVRDQPPRHSTKPVWKPFSAAERLLEHLADLEHVDHSGMQPIHEAVRLDNQGFAEFLVKNGANLGSKCCPPAGKTSYHIAAEYDSWKVFEGPLGDLLNETIMDNYNNAPICIAANSGSIRFAKKLFQVSKRDGVVEEIDTPCLYPPNYNLRDTGEPLHIAVSSNQLNFVDFLLEYAGAALIQSLDSAGRSPLHVAAMRLNGTDIAEHLLAKGAELEAKDLLGRTPFLFAIERGATLFAEYLVNKGADASAIDFNGFTAFHIANSADTMNYLLGLQLINGISFNINSKSRKCRETPNPSESCLITGGISPLMSAILEGKRADFVRFLVNHNADLEVVNDFGQTAFHLAVRSGNIEHLHVLLKKLTNSSILARKDRNGDTSLHIAVKNSNFEAIAAILSLEIEGKKQANIATMLSGDGLTPLHQAIASKSPLVVEILLNNGAKVSHLDAFGRSALRFAVHKTFTQDGLTLFKMLLERAKNESALDLEDLANGDTALHRAVDLEISELVDLLLEHGASCMLRNRQGQTPLHLALANGFGDIGKRLLKHSSCDLFNAVDSEGKTILESPVIQTVAPKFIEENLLSRTVDCIVLARKIQLAIGMSSLSYAEILAKTMGAEACGYVKVAINTLNQDGFSAFHTALINGDLKAVDWCLQNGASVSKRTRSGRSPMTLALFGELTEQVVQFVKNVTLTLADDDTSCVAVDFKLKYAAAKRRDLIRILIRKDALLMNNCIDEDNSNTPLHYLAALGDVEMGTEIVANGKVNVNTNSRNRDGLTPLHLAAMAGGRDAVDFMELLLDYSGDVSIAASLTTKFGDTGYLPLHVAASRCGNADTLDSLVYHVIHEFERISAVTFLSRVSTKNGLTTAALAAKYHHIDLYMRMVEVFEYFRSWNKQPQRSVYTMQNIRAIMPLPSGREAVVVCYNGDVMGISTDCDRILWRSKVFPPQKYSVDYQGIYHAALDVITKHVYFTFHHPMREAGIFYTTLSRLTTQSNDVILEPLVTNGTDDRQFLAVFVDAERETILANDPWVGHDIAAFSLADGELINGSSVRKPSAIDKFEPLFCSLSRPSPPVANTDSGPRLLAVSDYTHRIHLFTRKPRGLDQNEVDTKFIATIAEEDKNYPNRLGAVFYPADITFDHLGNLFVADYLNRRLQIFAAADLLDGTTLRAVWATDKLRSEVQRVAVSVSKNFTATALVGLESGHVLCFKHTDGL